MVETYYKYLKGEITRDDLYAVIPEQVLDSVLNYEISDESLPEIFSKIDQILNGKQLDLIIGGPPCQAYSLVGRARSDKDDIYDTFHVAQSPLF